MYANLQAKDAYGQVSAAFRSETETEYQIFAKITAALARYKSSTGAEYPKFVDALNRNRRLWVLIATDVASQDNALSEQLRAQLFYLYEFTMQHTADVLAGTANADALIDINRSVMRGMTQQGQAA